MTSVTVDPWGPDGWAVVMVRVARCEGCSYCEKMKVPTDFLSHPDAEACCARCLHGVCPGASA
jgi:hypothetical protein